MGKYSRAQGFILVEIMTTLSIFLIVVCLIFSVIESTSRTSKYINSNIVAQQELLISINILTNILEEAVLIKKEDISKSKITCLNKNGEELEIYYKKGKGLCIKDDNNLISNRVCGLELKLVEDNILYIFLTVRGEKEDISSKTAVRVKCI